MYSNHSDNSDLSILCGIGGLCYVNYIYKTYIIDSFSAYPEPVAQKLRRALYYTNQNLQPKSALKYYRQAIEKATELGMDPFSDEILGVKIQIAAMFEKAGSWPQAIRTLELVRANCLDWIEEVGAREGNEGRRTKVLRKIIGISVRLGEYYASEYVKDYESAEERLVWAVTAALKEQRRREVDGVKEGEGPWLEDEEIGGTLEGVLMVIDSLMREVIELTDGVIALGNRYEAQNKHYLAAPLFLQALGLCPPRSCHSVVLMNNLAASLALQNPPPTPGQPPASISAQLDAASTWAQRALTLAKSIEPPQRTQECDEGCAVATINLGDFAMMDGRIQDARQWWEEGKSLCKVIGMLEGVQRAEEALKALDKKGA
ncbi:MAG: hypothetical protein Q9163_000279 [Psora crenata]